MDFLNETAKLTINDAYAEDSGDYSCEIWNEVGQTEAPFHITVKEKKGKPRARTASKVALIPDIQVEPNYEPEGPKKAAAAKDRKISQASSKLDMIDESSKYHFRRLISLETNTLLCYQSKNKQKKSLLEIFYLRFAYSLKALSINI